MNSAVVAILSLAELLCAAAPGSAQTPAPTAFDVVSIKPSDLNRQGPAYRIGPGSITLRASLKDLIRLAYDVETYQLTGGPAWAQTELFDIQAKAADTAGKPQLKSMLQALLADRFQLKLSRQTKSTSCYILSVDKNGPKLPAPKTDVPADSAGVIQMGGGEIWSRGSTIGHLAVSLGYELEAPVLDQTGIQGNYDFKLRFDAANHDPTGDNARAAATPIAPSVFVALHEIGLRLDPRKMPIDLLVIDSAERPAAN